MNAEAFLMNLHRVFKDNDFVCFQKLEYSHTCDQRSVETLKAERVMLGTLDNKSG